jgi:hypothetical protein
MSTGSKSARELLREIVLVLQALGVFEDIEIVKEALVVARLLVKWRPEPLGIIVDPHALPEATRVCVFGAFAEPTPEEIRWAMDVNWSAGPGRFALMAGDIVWTDLIPTRLVDEKPYLISGAIACGVTATRQLARRIDDARLEAAGIADNLREDILDVRYGPTADDEEADEDEAAADEEDEEPADSHDINFVPGMLRPQHPEEN